MGHAFSLDERLLHVPLAAAGPGADMVTPAPTLAALPAAIAAATGLEQHPWHEQPARPGVAVAEFEPPVGDISDSRVDFVLDRWGLGADAAKQLTTSLATATEGGLKLLRRGDREELYNLGSDPLERAPLDPGSVDSATLTRLREALAVADRGALGEAPAEAPEAQLDDAEIQALEERMRLLGYM